MDASHIVMFFECPGPLSIDQITARIVSSLRQRAMDLQDQWEGKRLLNRNLLPEEVIADLLILKFKQRAGIAGIADHPAVLKNLPGVVVRNRCVFDLPGVVREENAEVVQAQVQVFA